MSNLTVYQKPAYLGDGVYADFDGYLVWLSVGDGDNWNSIALEPEVLESLLKYIKDLKEQEV